MLESSKCWGTPTTSVYLVLLFIYSTSRNLAERALKSVEPQDLIRVTDDFTNLVKHPSKHRWFEYPSSSMFFPLNSETHIYTFKKQAAPAAPAVKPSCNIIWSFTIFQPITKGHPRMTFGKGLGTRSRMDLASEKGHLKRRCLKLAWSDRRNPGWHWHSSSMFGVARREGWLK